MGLEFNESKIESKGDRRLPILETKGDPGEPNLEAMFRADQWIEKMAGLTFTKSEKSNITLLVGGLTMAHDYLVEAGLSGVGYNVQRLDVPDTAAFQVGKEFGNRGQCNPTYFTVGSLVKFLITLRDKHGMTADEIVKKYVFLTAGACGPCRFGMYVTEYRKALRDAGFDGFRVVLFQQTGGLKQATGEESGLELNPPFFLAIVKALVAGDVINALGYRIRPYEVVPGATDAALEKTKQLCYDALLRKKSILKALWQGRALLKAVQVDRLQPKPKVAIIGEFWAMTTEGDGNYHLQRFLEKEGAEVDAQLVTAWLLYNIWEAKFDTTERQKLRENDHSKLGLGDADPLAVGKKLITLSAADRILRVVFQTFAHAIGLYGYTLPNMEEIAEISHQHYDNNIRGGEGHMEVGKLILNVLHSKAHMTLSVKPFGCMPSAGVSDGVQSLITEKLPGAIFCPVETSGDGAVNFQSRVQMFLFKAKQAAQDEYTAALASHGVAAEQIGAVLREKAYRGALWRAEHRYAGSAADVVGELAPFATMTRRERARVRSLARARAAWRHVTEGPKRVASEVRVWVRESPEWARRASEDVKVLWEMRQR